MVLEPDPTYEYATSPRGSGGVRRLFSRPENVALGSFGLEFYRTFHQTMAIDGEPADIAFKALGYLFLSDNGGHDQMEANFRTQQTEGVNAFLLDRSELASRYPSLNFSDVALGVLTPDDAFIDPYAALMGFRRNAIRLGVEYRADRVVGWSGGGGVARCVELESGDVLSASQFVLAAGAWSGEVAAFLDWDVPVQPMSRQTHFFRCKTELEPFPFLKTETNLAFRPEGLGYTGGIPDWSVPSGFNWNFAPDWFESEVWPLLARRVPALEELKLERTWACHYERCLLDSNGIVGKWDGGMENVYLACGFSGHGIMQAPGVGLALSELILDGRYSSMDLTRLGYQRIKDNDPYPELGIV